MPGPYDLDKIRALLREGFIVDELRHFCQVVPEFRSLCDEMTPDLAEADLADRIVDHAQAGDQVEKVLTWARKHNPARYEAGEPYRTAQPPPPSEERPLAPTAEPSPLPVTVPGGARIGDVQGSIYDSTIAGRDVKRTHIGQVIVNAFRRPDPQSMARRNRQNMLHKVKSFWVEGVLERSLHGLARLELGMEERSGAVDHPLGMVLRSPDQPDEALPPGTQIVDLFDRMGRALLILGEPGSGKTTTLLELARATLARAEADPMQPMPVVFNLSSWTQDRKPVAEWLVDELKTKYRIPSKIGHAWVEERALLLLLDGLDEVKAGSREACAEALNRFSPAYGLKNIVICSRIAEYEALTTRLQLSGAILLQPLTPGQVDAYLARAGDELATVRALLREDEPLQELARSPLMLSVMTLAYRGMPVRDLEGPASIAKRRTHLLNAYVDRMFQRVVRTQQEPYPREQSVDWLSWLAQRMIQHNQSLFLLEGLQPDWLVTGKRPGIYGAIYQFLVRGLFSLMGGILVALLVSIVAKMIDRQPPMFLGIPFDTLILLGTLGFALLRSVQTFMGLGELEGVLPRIEPLERLQWSLQGLAISLGLAILAGGFFALIIPTLGLLVGAGLLLYGALTQGLERAGIEVRSYPNQGIRRSAGYALVAGLVFGLVAAAVGWALTGFLERIIEPDTLRWLRFASILAGFVAGAWAWGGYAVYQHAILRVLLVVQGHVPWNYVRFLDYATERIFLRQVGGGYIFIHRLLQEHFCHRIDPAP